MSIKAIAENIQASDTVLETVIQEFMDGRDYFGPVQTVDQWRVANYVILRKLAYPNLAEKADAEVKLKSGDPDLVTEGTAQLAQYYVDCLAVKARFPKE